ncbi:MAG: hypothetical protein JJLCMIEE_03500 [Acidimicrobiales bacterium]|nr:hypothetical protein [Acidimicrobiales bacterium]
MRRRDPRPLGRAAPLEGCAPEGSDPVRERRARVLRWTNVGQRIGYLMFSVFLVVVVVGLVLGFNLALAVLGIAGLAIGSLVLAPSIILAHGVRAAEKEERGEPFGY